MVIFKLKSIDKETGEANYYTHTDDIITVIYLLFCGHKLCGKKKK